MWKKLKYKYKLEWVTSHFIPTMMLILGLYLGFYWWLFLL